VLENDVKKILEFEPVVERLISKRNQISAARPMPQIALQKIKEGLFIEWTYNSNGIEGNTLSLNETRLVLQDGMTVKGKSLREHFEITNHHEAIDLLEQIVSPEYKLCERDILDIHELVMQRIEKDFAGRIRNAGVRVVGANFVPPNAVNVPELLTDLIAYVNTNPDKLHDLLLATVFHHRFVWIHPFFDGNGRTVRLAMNLLLMRTGFPPAIILKNDRKKYYQALNDANNGSYHKLTLLMLQAVERSLDIYIGALPETTYEYKLISSLVEEEQLPYGQEYLSLLARQGKIDAYKENRNWLTTIDAIESYITTRKRKR